MCSMLFRSTFLFLFVFIFAECFVLKLNIGIFHRISILFSNTPQSIVKYSRVPFVLTLFPYVSLPSSHQTFHPSGNVIFKLRYLLNSRFFFLFLSFFPETVIKRDIRRLRSPGVFKFHFDVTTA